MHQPRGAFYLHSDAEKTLRTGYDSAEVGIMTTNKCAPLTKQKVEAARLCHGK